VRRSDDGERSRPRFSCVTALEYIPESIAGATITGALVARTVHVSISSAIPAAIFAIVFAVAGATSTTSARSASAICSTLNSEESSHMSVTTGRCVTARKLRGVTNSIAAFVITTSTPMPRCVSLLAMSTAL
jgi:hypothetical protein